VRRPSHGPVEVFIEAAKLNFVSAASLAVTKVEVARIAQEESGLRERIERLLDKMAEDR